MLSTAHCCDSFTVKEQQHKWKPHCLIKADVVKINETNCNQEEK